MSVSVLFKYVELCKMVKIKPTIKGLKDFKNGKDKNIVKLK